MHEPLRQRTNSDFSVGLAASASIPSGEQRALAIREPAMYHAFMLVLASHSPRRRELLSNAGIEFITRPAEVDERTLDGESPRAHVERLARAKAMAVEAGPGEIVLAADTEVVVDERVLGKPADAVEAAAMLRLLSGREHEVITGVCLRSGDRVLVDAESTRVRFVPMSESEIAEYAASGEPMDKAGAYAIQGLASRFIDRIEGCYFNVVGLPVALVCRRLKELSAVSESGGTHGTSTIEPQALS